MFGVQREWLLTALPYDHTINLPPRLRRPAEPNPPPLAETRFGRIEEQLKNQIPGEWSESQAFPRQDGGFLTLSVEMVVDGWFVVTRVSVTAATTRDIPRRYDTSAARHPRPDTAVSTGSNRYHTSFFVTFSSLSSPKYSYGLAHNGLLCLML